MSTSWTIHLRVNNLVDAIRFYQHAFDAVIYFDRDNDGSVHLQVFGAHLVLNKPGSEPAGRLFFTCPNIEAVLARAKAAGRCEVTVRRVRFCDCCLAFAAEVTDPFNNVWCFRQTVPRAEVEPNYKLFAGMIGMAYTFVQKLQLRPSEYAVIVLMLLWNKYTWAFWDARIAPKLDSVGARIGNLLIENS